MAPGSWPCHEWKATAATLSTRPQTLSRGERRSFRVRPGGSERSRGSPRECGRQQVMAMRTAACSRLRMPRSTEGLRPQPEARGPERSPTRGAIGSLNADYLGVLGLRLRQLAVSGSRVPLQVGRRAGGRKWLAPESLGPSGKTGRERPFVTGPEVPGPCGQTNDRTNHAHEVSTKQAQVFTKRTRNRGWAIGSRRKANR